MIKKYQLAMLLFAATLIFTSCGKDDPDIPDEPELITTLNYTLSPMNTGPSVTLSFKDLDGDGGMAPVITGGTLAANQVYLGTLELLNESASPIENISEEVEEEDEDHQFFFMSDIANLTVEYNDQDPNGNPLGLSTTLTTGAPASGSITITLRHEPEKSGAGVSAGDITNAGGETDIEVTSPIDVQ